MRLVFLVEGKTEKESLKAFFRKWLDSNKLSDIGIDIFSLKSASRVFAEAPERARDLLAARDGKDIIAVFSLLGLYGAGVYPDDKQTVQERCEWGKQEMEGRFPDPRYKHFFAVHETEAWLLSQPRCFPTVVGKALQKHARAPEKVNFVNHPESVINEQYSKHLGRGYGKVRDGRRIFKDGKFDPRVAGDLCPYLKRLLDEMLQLAGKAPRAARRAKR